MKIKIPFDFKGEITLECTDRINDYNKFILAKTYLENALMNLIINEGEEDFTSEYLDKADYSEFPIKIPFVKKPYVNPTSNDLKELKAEVSNLEWNLGEIKIPK